MYSSRNYRLMLAMLIISPMVIVSTVSAQEVLLRDDFDGSGMVNTDVWRLPFGSEGTFVGRTQYRGDPATDIPSQGIAEPLATDGLVSEIYLDTYSPVDPGNQFLGTDLISKRNFARGGGLAFEGRLRLAPSTNTGGVIGGFFTFDVTRETPPGTPVRDEIDFELLSNEIVTPTPQRILTNVFDEDGFAGPGSGGNPAFHNVGGLDLTEFQDYRVEWTPQSVRWFVNDSLVRVETEDVPDDPQKLHFNLWAPDSGFSEAFNAALQPALTEGANQRFTAQIDSVEVTRFNTTVSDNLITDGSFESISQPTPIQNVAATTTGQWLKFGNVNFVTAGSSDNVPPFGGDGVDGFQIATMFGPFNGGPDASGLLQNVVAEPGQEFEASVLSQTLNTDSIAGTENYTTVAISFLDSSGNVIEDAPFVATDGKDFPLLDGRDPNITEDEFVRGTVNAKAPAGTAYARLSLFFLQLNNEGGAAVFEDASLRLLTADAPPIVPGDFNADGIVNAADYTVWRDNLGLDAAALNGAGSGGAVVVQADYDLWSANYGSLGGTSSVAVPEPAGLAVMLVGSLAMVCRRQRRQA